MSERISDAEHAVMEVLWEESPLTAQEVVERVPAERDWSANTVKTLLAGCSPRTSSRMRRKGGATAIARSSRAAIMSRANRGG